MESDNEEDGDEDEHEINEDGEKVPKKEGGPWNKGKVEGEHIIKAFACKVFLHSYWSLLTLVFDDYIMAGMQFQKLNHRH